MKRTIISLFTVLTIFALTAVSVYAARQIPKLAVDNNFIPPVVSQPLSAPNMVWEAVDAIEEVAQLHAPIVVENRLIARIETNEPSDVVAPAVIIDTATTETTTSLTALDGNPLSACLTDAIGSTNTVVVAPGERFVQSWDVENAGNCRWNTDYQLTYVRGDKMGSIEQVGLVSGVGAGSSANFWAQLTAPTIVGEYETVWQMQDEFGNLFGDEIVTQVVVTNDSSENGEQSTINEVTAIVTGGTTYTANRYRLDFHSPSAKEMAETYLGNSLSIQNNVLTFNGKSCTLDQSSSKRVDTGSYLVHTYERSPGSLAFAPGAMTVIACGDFGEVMFNHNYLKTPQVVLRLNGMFVYFLEN